jgi:hypothetical protein
MSERSIFLEALDKEDPTERSTFLDTACAGDDELRQRVEALLKSHAEAGNFLGKLAPQLLAEELPLPQTAEMQGETPANGQVNMDLGFLTPSDKTDALGRLGHYDILDIIGRGGMGIVLRAFDEKLHRVVAIKVMAAQLATNAAARKRFSREAQAQAAISHDHVAPFMRSRKRTGCHTWSCSMYPACRCNNGSTKVARFSLLKLFASACKRLRVWPPPTARASYTVTSSQPTSFWKTASNASRSPILAWRGSRPMPA